MNQSLNDDQEQCAQPALAPVPASSQAASSFSSNTTHLIRPHDIPPLPTVEEESEDYDLDALPAKFIPATWLRAVPPEVPTSVTSAIAEPVTEHDKIDDLPSVSFASTHPTLPLSQPYVPPGLVTEVPEQDAESDVTTDDEMECDVPESSSGLDVQREHLHRIARELFARRQSDLPKPAPAGRPEVWADGRQELCETLHYFRAYQSASYSTGDFARGFMFDKVAHPRDYMDEEVVISRAGGGLVKDKGSGEMKSGRDQAEDTKTVQALKNCMKHFNPVVIITGVDNPHAPSQPPHQYCVLDYFKPTNIWVEKSGKSKILRYRFEKLSTKKPSWWRPEVGHTSINLGSLDPPVAKTCHSCKIESIQVYLNGWMCLQPSCPAFWRIYEKPNAGSRSASHEPDEESLVYDPRFLKQKKPWPNDDSDYPLKSNNAEVSSCSLPGEDTSQAFWSGMVCPDCGRCNSRLSWLGWECMNATCNFKRQPLHLTIPAASLRDPFWPLTDSYTLSRDTHTSLIDVNVSFSHGYRINRYTIPGINGFITHMIANRTVTSEPGGPDAMFEELQQTDIDLRRRPMPNGQLKGESYCRHFTVNYGMPYKFIAATASHSFEHAARPITATRSRLNWAAKHLLIQETGKPMAEVSKEWAEKEFNEVLALGYFEAQKINYHDDGEFGLGPTIATLSLGAPGTMRIRMKARHYNGSSNAGVYDDAPPLPGCQKYDQRKELQHSLETLKHTDGKAYRARLKQIPRELGLKASGNARDVLRMELGHGDIVVMHGAELQRYHEHAVEHAGKLRFALTCRYIDPDSLKEGDRPGYVVGRDEGGYDGSKLCP
ncbi:hypothetical protein FB567DRAFT_437105 [Paraphoma chrysanthemicola]|uniref:Alpha-ketoglutarate-dependent dioxygenase AlkB-like domain-containing protein n=1 Tax=Paraphoma chrysanthemicola TaxID=798071 RepID=A0A8K0W1L5_9PLEO|nr:hypothetical protein FB567DRAFT_437105 [Paraphoma chrysanthemicola]